MISIESFYVEFQSLDSVYDKIAFLKKMSQMKLPYYINYDGLIAAWTKKL